MCKVTVNFEDGSAPAWARNFSQKEDIANLFIFGTFRSNRKRMWLKNQHVLKNWEYENLISFEENGDVTFDWKTQGEHVFFVLKWG